MVSVELQQQLHIIGTSSDVVIQRYDHLATTLQSSITEYHIMTFRLR